MPFSPRIETKKEFSIKGANANHLKSIDITFIQNGINCIRGISGSGKSSLLSKVIFESYSYNSPRNCTSIDIDRFDEVMMFAPEYQLKNETVASYLGVSDIIAKAFETQSGQKSKQFDWRKKEGACSNCKGTGYSTIDLDILSEINITCQFCNGIRYNDEALEFSYQDQNIFEIHNQTVGAFLEGHSELSNQNWKLQAN